MRKLTGSWGVPAFSFLAAVVLSLFCGTVTRAFRIAGESTGGGSCDVNMFGDALKDSVQYFITQDYLFIPASADPLSPPEEVKPPIDLTAARNTTVMNEHANGNLANSLDQFDVRWRHGSVLAASAGPTVVTYGRGEAALAFDITGRFPEWQFLNTTGIDINGNFVDLKATASGRTRNFMQIGASGTLEENISYGNCSALTMGDSVKLAEIPESMVRRIKALRFLIDKAIAALSASLPFDLITKGLSEGLKELLKKLDETAAEELLKKKILESLLSGGLDFLTTSENTVTLDLNGGHAPSTFKTILQWTYNDEGERTSHFEQPGPGPFKVLPAFLESTGDVLDLRITGEGTSTARARGAIGEGVSGVLSLWGYANMQCCKATDEQTHHKQWAWIRDTQHFAVSSDEGDFLKGHKLGRYLFKFNEVRAEYVSIFDKATQTADEQLRKDQCPAAQQTLQDMQKQIRKLLLGI